MILTELMQKSKFFRSSIFANIIIIFGMIPQFLVVPLIISYWGEVEYSKYVAFIAIVNIFAQINAAMQNGYILKLIPEEKFSANELSSMFILNVIMSVFMIIGVFLWSKYFSSNYEFSYLGYIICTVLLIFLLNSMKIIMQIGISVLFPLIISVLLSCVTIVLLGCIVFFQLEEKTELIKLIVISYSVVVFVSAVSSMIIIIKRGVIGEINTFNILKNSKFLLKFGGLSLAISTISNLFQNGSKVFLGMSFEPQFLVDFNLSFTLCMIIIQFISPIIGLIFPYLSKEKLTESNNITWICNLHKVYWKLVVLIYLLYSLILKNIIIFWLGVKYLYLSELVYIFLFYFIFAEAASIGVQYLKSKDRQFLTLLASINAFLFVPYILFVNIINFDVIQGIYIFCISGLVFYFLISLILIMIMKERWRFCKNYIPDALLGISSVVILSVSSTFFQHDLTLKIIASVTIVIMTLFWAIINPVKKMT